MDVEVDPTGGLGQSELLRRLAGVAQRATRGFLGDEDFDLELLNQSENTTYQISRATSGEKLVLRIHRTGYHTLAGIESELDWMEALRQEAGVRTPAVVRNDAGERVHNIATDEVPEGRWCVFSEFLEGDEPDDADLLSAFPDLGEVTARMHGHARTWKRPVTFERFSWNVETAFGANPHWGHWYDGPGMNDQARTLLRRTVDVLSRRLTQFGTDNARFGLVHCDMRLANLLIHQGETKVIDFDDCGFSWFLYDLATALSFREHHPDTEELVEAWLTGYRRVGRLSPEEESEIPSFLMYRRLLAVAWCGSHSETELATDLGAEFTHTTLPLAENYLQQFG